MVKLVLESDHLHTEVGLCVYVFIMCHEKYLQINVHITLLKVIMLPVGILSGIKVHCFN